MTPENIAICWAPTLFRSFDGNFIPLTAFIIDKFEYVFLNKAFPTAPLPSETVVSDSSISEVNTEGSENSEGITEGTISSSTSLEELKPDGETEVTGKPEEETPPPTAQTNGSSEDIKGKAKEKEKDKDEEEEPVEVAPALLNTPSLRARTISISQRKFSRPTNRMTTHLGGGLAPRADRFVDHRYATLVLSDIGALMGDSDSS